MAVQICTMLAEGGWTTVRDPDQQAVYSYKDRIWVGYDDLESVKIKVMCRGEERSVSEML